MAKNAGKKVGTRKQNGGSNKTLTEGRKFVRSRVLQPALEPLSNTVSSNPTVPGTSDHLELSPLTKTSHFRLSTRPMLRSSVVMLSTSQNHRISSIIILVNNMNGQHVKENTPPTYPQRQKPTPGILVFAKLAFLDSKVTRCYGCGYSLKPDGTIPDPPDDLVLTTRQVSNKRHQIFQMCTTISTHSASG